MKSILFMCLFVLISINCMEHSSDANINEVIELKFVDSDYVASLIKESATVSIYIIDLESLVILALQKNILFIAGKRAEVIKLKNIITTYIDIDSKNLKPSLGYHD
ncbi:hypothetical protein M1446_00735 [Candidatus Dependentiae bacterium]|nr:hypothetical protein [Candidatus Dependentiae bacterium]